MWVRTTENSRMTLLSAADTLDPDREWKLYLEDGRAHHQVLSDTNADSTPFQADKKLTDNQWHHILLNVDPAKNASFYIDGKWKGQFTLPFFNAVWNSNTLQLGRSLRSTGSSDFFKGQIDDIRIYSRPLFQAEIETLSYANTNRGPTFSLPSSKVVTPFDPFDLSLIKPIVQDDGRLNPTLTYSWSLLNGPGSLTFNDASSPTPTIEFGKIGDYKIRLVADDGEIQTFRDLEIEHINGNNDKPMALGIGDLTLNENANTKAINLHEAFEDLQDTDTQLTFSITANSKPSLFQRLEIKGDPDNLHLIPATGQLGTSNISIRATDREGNFTDTNFSVTVRNQPPNILQQTLYLEENSPAGTIVGTLQAEDPDGDTPIFQIIAGNETGFFTIEPSNGRISLRPDAKVDYETTPSHTLNVAVTDERNPSPENNAEIRIYIVDQNEAPTVADATFNLGDTLKTGELVGPISGSDPEGDSLLFEITSGNEDGLFAIDANGILSIAKQATLDPLQEPRRTLVVRASDTGRPSLSGTGKIRINISRQAVGRNSSLLYLVPDDDSVDNIWMQTDFDDSEWDTGKLGLGYDTNADYDDVISTDLLTLMQDMATTAFARIPFQVQNTVAVGELRLRYAYDDGCIVYLNGRKILSHNAPPNPCPRDVNKRPFI
ncbi:MAG: cadherin domain-containing protein, partial [Opitutae bacterium]